VLVHYDSRTVAMEVGTRYLNKFLEYNNDVSTNVANKPINYSLGTAARESSLSTNSNTVRLHSLTDTSLQKLEYPLLKLINYPSTTSLLGSETDSKRVANPFKYLLNSKWSKKNFLDNNNSDILNANDTTFTTKFFNEDLVYRFKDLQSSNQQLLTSDRNTRLINNLTPNKTILNFNDKGSNLNSLIHNSVSKSLTNTQETLYSKSALS
jgi:hypothetical protein